MTDHCKALLICALIVAAALCAVPALAAGATVAGATNLVSAENGGRVVDYSSEALDENRKVNPKWQVTNLIDGKFVTGTHTPADSYGWRSQGVPSPESPQYVIFAFADDKPRLISRVVCDPTTADPEFLGRWAKDMRISVCTTDKPDGPYKTVGTYLLVRRGIKQTFDFLPVEARFVKLEITGNWGSDLCVEMGEFEVYEAIVGDDVLDQLIMRLMALLEDLKRYRDSQRYQQAQATTEAVATKAEAASARANE